MNTGRTVKSFEYTNDFLYIIIRQAPEHGPRTFLFCSGVNLTSFAPLSKSNFGICSNPAFKGLQLLRAAVSAFSNKKGIRPTSVVENSCAAITPRGDGWYRESLMLENVGDHMPQELVRFSVVTLVEKVLSVCVPGMKVPGFSPDPGKLQAYLESLIRK